MSDRAEIEREIQEKISEGERAYDRLKLKLDAAGDEASAEAKQALASAGSLLDKGKAKMRRLADATDDEFDDLWADTRDDWNEMKADMSGGWKKFTSNVREFLG